VKQEWILATPNKMHNDSTLQHTISNQSKPHYYHTVGLQIKQRTITHREPAKMNVNVRVSCDVINEWNLIGNYSPFLLLHYRNRQLILHNRQTTAISGNKAKR